MQLSTKLHPSSKSTVTQLPFPCLSKCSKVSPLCGLHHGSGSINLTFSDCCSGDVRPMARNTYHLQLPWLPASLGTQIPFLLHLSPAYFSNISSFFFSFFFKKEIQFPYSKMHVLRVSSVNFLNIQPSHHRPDQCIAHSRHPGSFPWGPALSISRQSITIDQFRHFLKFGFLLFSYEHP